MPFTSALRQSLEARNDRVTSELCRGDSLEEVLDRHLLAVEQMAEGELVTSILLLSANGKRLSHGAAPNLPRSYRESIDGLDIGPSVGSCGTAAYFGCPIYVDDIAVDPLWADYRHLALEHGLRSCWSTPIRDDQGAVIGTFAIYHRTAGRPTLNELEAIDMIAGHVAHAIMSARDSGHRNAPRAGSTRKPPRLKLVDSREQDSPTGAFAELMTMVTKLEAITAEIERQARSAGSEEARVGMEILAEDSRKLAQAIRSHLAGSAEFPR